ncbi:uncharacterized protein CMU_028980 [Cryptosporidium muris RN66]|uniref:Probable cytosolic iron-sulfur protein assembly protein CIAO1 homolog n=1 Tax=Cryptosporidium muris (strain RN66) TaxID=441375 RepID=B6AHY3_CRYMR|nr:uncharacterized protein CMU_028980 [Cryptosporidium muris RN66]EEA07824.1 hypothetical protein, conserved [Cryptosporidium muris RN66]|eukprot:XP_002142173.1 hypothetical protein [Cryptosporidium muris RN66]
MLNVRRLDCIGTLDHIIWNICTHPNLPIIASCGESHNISLWFSKSLNKHLWYPKDDSFSKYNSKNSDWILAYQFGDINHKKTIRRVCWSPCGNMIIAGSFDGTASIWEFVPSTKVWNCISILQGPENEVKGIDWNKYNNFIALCSRDRSIWIFSIVIESRRAHGSQVESECHSVLTGHTQDIKTVKWHPTNSLVLFSCSYDNTIIIWGPEIPISNFENQNIEWIKWYVLEGHLSTVWDITFDLTGDYCITCSDDSSLILWKAKKSYNVNFTNPGKNIIKSATMNTSFRILTENSTQVVNNYLQKSSYSGFLFHGDNEYSPPIYSVDWCQYLNCIVAGSGDNSLHFFSLSKDELKHLKSIEDAHKNDINSVSWLHNNNGKFVSAGDDGNIILWEVTFIEIEE